MSKKTFLSGLASALAIACVVLLPNAKVSAATPMTTITPNTSVTGQLATAEAQNYYRFEVDKTGYFNISFAPDDISEDVVHGWDLTLCDNSTGAKIQSWSGIKNSYKTFKFPFKAGTKFYLKVAARTAIDGYAPTNVKYKLKVATTEKTTWENEYNDTVAKATVLTPNKAMNGNLYKVEDVDYFKYTVQSNGTQVFSLAPSDMTLDTYLGWNMSIIDASTNKELWTWERITVKNVYPPIDFKKGTKLLIRITAYSAYEGYAPTGQDYILNVKETASDKWELENRIPSSAGWSAFSKGATPMTIDTTYKGTLWINYDEDLYKVVASKNGTLNIVFNPKDISDNLGLGYNYTLFDSKGNKIDAKEQVKTKISKKYYLPAGTYYVKLNAYSTYSAPTDKVYEITAKLSAFTPEKVASVKHSGSKITWKKQSGISGYEISYATKSSFSGAKTTTSSKNYKELKLTKGKTYYVRVRSYKKTFNGKKVYGSWSKTLKFKR